ncbi:hypothetical protein D3C81_989000 [compost metagenome]
MKLTLPVIEQRNRGDNQCWFVIRELFQVPDQEGEQLDRFSEPHVISEQAT